MRRLPLRVPASRCRDRAVVGSLAARGDCELDRVEELRRALATPLFAELLIALELVCRVLQPFLAERRGLALDHGERDAVDEHRDVRRDALACACHTELLDGEELVGVRRLEVEVAHRAAGLAAVLLRVDGDAIRQRHPDLLVRLDQRRRVGVRDRTDRAAHAIIREPGIEPAQRPLEPRQ